MAKKRNPIYMAYIDLFKERGVYLHIDSSDNGPVAINHSIDPIGVEATTVWLIDGVTDGNPSWAAVCTVNPTIDDTCLYMARIDKETADLMRYDVLSNNTLDLSEANAEQKKQWLDIMATIDGCKNGNLKRIGDVMYDEEQAIDMAMRVASASIDVSDSLPPEMKDKVTDTICAKTELNGQEKQLHVLQRNDEHPMSDIIILSKSNENDTWRAYHAKGAMTDQQITTIANSLLNDTATFGPDDSPTNNTITNIEGTIQTTMLRPENPAFANEKEALQAAAEGMYYATERTKQYIADMQTANASVRTYGTDVVASKYSDEPSITLVDVRGNGAYVVSEQGENNPETHIAPIDNDMARMMRRQMLGQDTSMEHLQESGLPKDISTMPGITIDTNSDKAIDGLLANIVRPDVANMPSGMIAAEHSKVALPDQSVMNTYVVLDVTEDTPQSWAVFVHDTRNGMKFTNVPIDNDLARKMSQDLAEHGTINLANIPQWDTNLRAQANLAVYSPEAWEELKADKNPYKTVVAVMREIPDIVKDAEWTKADNLHEALSNAFAEIKPDVSVPGTDMPDNKSPEAEDTPEI